MRPMCKDNYYANIKGISLENWGDLSNCDSPSNLYNESDSRGLILDG